MEARFLLPSGRIAEVLEYDPGRQIVLMQYVGIDPEVVELPESVFYSDKVEVLL